MKEAVEAENSPVIGVQLESSTVLFASNALPPRPLESNRSSTTKNLYT